MFDYLFFTLLLDHDGTWKFKLQQNLQLDLSQALELTDAVLDLADVHYSISTSIFALINKIDYQFVRVFHPINGKPSSFPSPSDRQNPHDVLLLH